MNPKTRNTNKLKIYSICKSNVMLVIEQTICSTQTIIYYDYGSKLNLKYILSYYFSFIAYVQNNIKTRKCITLHDT